MRYVPVGAIRDNMILAKNIYGEQGQLLLNAGSKMTDSNLNSMKSMGFSGVYVQDSLSEDIEIESIICDDLRNRIMDGVKMAFIEIEKNKEPNYECIELKDEIGSILEQILDNGDLMINISDLKTFDEYTYQHSINVAVLSMAIGKKLNLNSKEIYSLGLAALLHDIGKVFIPKEILNKPGRLNEYEMNIIKTHPKLGYEYLKSRYKFSESMYIGVLDHHEKYNGEGYPNQKKNSEISFIGRIINVADVYDALTTKRSYRKALLSSEAIDYIVSERGRHFDPQIVDIFVNKIAPYI